MARDRPPAVRVFPGRRAAPDRDAKIELLLDDPESYGDYDKPSDQWTTDFGEGAGLIVYAVVHQNVKVIVLRLVA